MAVVDLIGVGLGPANLGLAVAAEESPRPSMTARFLDRRSEFSWHPDMLLASSVMQVSYLKDLVTQRNPQSAYSFVNYIHQQGRMSDFINRQSFFPSRAEYTDYLRWVVDRITSPVDWNAEVVAVDVNTTGGVDVRWRQGGAEHISSARFVSLGVGSLPSLPGWAKSLSGSTRVFHNTRLISGLAELALPSSARVAVIGQGQSAAESVRHVLEAMPGTSVDCYLSGYGMVPADDSPFANRVFDPSAVDDFYHAPDDVRDEVLKRHRTTNYSCVDPDLIDWLSDFEYSEKISGDDRLRFCRVTQIDGARQVGKSVSIDVQWRLNSTSTVERYDAIICATGFSAPIPRHLFGESFGNTADLKLNREYMVCASDGTVHPVFVVGSTESNHGIASGLLSNIAVRSGDVIDSITTREARLASVGS